MANWCNARLLVAGPRAEVESFARLVRARPSAVFRGDMLAGEGGDLQADRLTRLDRGLARTGYRFQIRNDDGRAYFTNVSGRFPDLCFVLTFFDANAAPHAGSFFIASGRSRAYLVPDTLVEAVMERHGCAADAGDDEEWRFWEAAWELMDLAEAHWKGVLRGALGAPRGAGAPSTGAAPSHARRRPAAGGRAAAGRRQARRPARRQRGRRR